MQHGDRAAFEEWVKAHIADRPGSDNEVVYHGMVIDPRILLPDEPAVRFVRDESFINAIIQHAGGPI